MLVLLLVLPVAAWAESRCDRPQETVDEDRPAAWSGWELTDGEGSDTVGDQAGSAIDHDAAMAEYLDLDVDAIREWRERSEERNDSLQADHAQVDQGIREARHLLAERLARRGDATALVGAALVSAELLAGPGNDRAMAWLDRAAGLAPHDARPLWAAQAICAWMIDTCDRRRWLERLVTVEPDNAAAWLQLLSVTTPDEPMHADAFANALSADRYEPADSVLRPMLFESYDGLELSTQLSADFTRLLNQSTDRAAFAEADTTSLPSLIGAMQGMMLLTQASPDPLDASCGAMEKDSIPAARAQACVDLYQRRFESSTTLVDRSLTLMGVLRLLAGDERAAAWEARQRQYQWIQTEAARLMVADPALGFDASYWRVARERGEIAAVERLLIEAGIPLDPPVDWDANQAQREVVRDLIIDAGAD